MTDQLSAIGLTILTYYAYACAAATWALRLLPSPEDTVKIFMLQVPPKFYLILFNFLRWLSGNRSWVDRNGNGAHKP